MKTLLIVGYENITKEGLTIQFNQKYSLNNNLATDKWWVSWDKIGKLLCGDDYCEETQITELRKIKEKI